MLNLAHEGDFLLLYCEPFSWLEPTRKTEKMRAMEDEMVDLGELVGHQSLAWQSVDALTTVCTEKDLSIAG